MRRGVTIELYVVALAGRPQARDLAADAPTVERVAPVGPDHLDAATRPGVGGDPLGRGRRGRRGAALARGFTAPVRGRNAGNQDDAVAARAELDAWLTEAGACGVPAMETFAAGLGRDSDAIRAALTTPWSNGQTEGQVNRLKLLKRQSYGRAGFDLLRRHVLIAA